MNTCTILYIMKKRIQRRQCLDSPGIHRNCIPKIVNSFLLLFSDKITLLEVLKPISTIRSLFPIHALNGCCSTCTVHSLPLSPKHNVRMYS